MSRFQLARVRRSSRPVRFAAALALAGLAVGAIAATAQNPAPRPAAAAAASITAQPVDTGWG
jgi:hypothetical protein